MRLALMLLPSCLVAATPLAVNPPRPAPPTLLHVPVPRIPWWDSAERARVASRSPFAIPGDVPGKPKPMPLLLPYPRQAPPDGRSYFFLQ